MLAVDTRQHYVYGYTARHSFWEKEPSFTQQGPIEVKRLTDDLTKLVIGVLKPDDNKRWRHEIPHKSMNNHFSGNHIIRYVGEGGRKGTWTTAPGRLHKENPKMHL